MNPKKIALFGGGPACLMAALQLSTHHEVHLFEKGKTIGRKFLVAGKGGFNLTNKASGQDLLKAYSNDSVIHDALYQFDAVATRKWLFDLGVDTYIGTSGRVFPKQGIKPAEVLAQIKRKLIENGVSIHLNHEFIGFDAEIQPQVKHLEKSISIQADHYIFGLGGGSWKKTGSNDTWLAYFKAIGVKTTSFKPANCGLVVDWSADFAEKFAGQPLKNVAVQLSDKSVKGEVLISAYGIEGNAVYPLSSAVGKLLEENDSIELTIDLKPNNTVEELVNKTIAKNLKPKNYAYMFNLTKASLALVKNTLSKEAYLDPKRFANRLKKVPVVIKSLRQLDEAISTVGGVLMTEIQPNFQLKKHPRIAVIGEMLDWDAPTGGFLLQACFSSGFVVAQEID